MAQLLGLAGIAGPANVSFLTSLQVWAELEEKGPMAESKRKPTPEGQDEDMDPGERYRINDGGEERPQGVMK